MLIVKRFFRGKVTTFLSRLELYSRNTTMEIVVAEV